MKKTLSVALIAAITFSCLTFNTAYANTSIPTRTTDIPTRPIVPDVGVVDGLRQIFDGYIVPGDYEVLEMAWPNFFTVTRLTTRYNNADDIGWHLIHTDGTSTSTDVNGRRVTLSKYNIYEVRQFGTRYTSSIFSVLAAPSALVPKSYKLLYPNKKTGNLGYYADGNILLTKVSSVQYSTSAIASVIPSSYFQPKYIISPRNGQNGLRITEPVKVYTFRWNDNIKTTEYLAAVTEAEKQLTFYLIPNTPRYSSLAQAQSALHRGDFFRNKWRVVAAGTNGLLIGQIPSGVGSEQLKYALWQVLTPTFAIR